MTPSAGCTSYHLRSTCCLAQTRPARVSLALSRKQGRGRQAHAEGAEGRVTSLCLAHSCCARQSSQASACIISSLLLLALNASDLCPQLSVLACSAELAATLVHPASGRALDILTTAPTMVLYTGQATSSLPDPPRDGCSRAQPLRCMAGIGPTGAAAMALPSGRQQQAD